MYAVLNVGAETYRTSRLNLHLPAESCETSISDCEYLTNNSCTVSPKQRVSMAAPPAINIKNLSGKYVMNKTISDDTDPMLALQGLSWFTRKAISLATVVLTVDEYVKTGVYHIDINSVAAGFASTQEDRILNWTENDHSDRIFGTVKGRSRIFQLQNFEMQGAGPPDDARFLKAETLKDMKTPTRFLDDESGHIQSWAVSQGGGWTAEQVWGFEEVDGKRYYARRVVVRKGDQVQRVRLIYDYKGPAEAQRNEDEDLAYGEE